MKYTYRKKETNEQITINVNTYSDELLQNKVTDENILNESHNVFCHWGTTTLYRDNIIWVNVNIGNYYFE